MQQNMSHNNKLFNYVLRQSDGCSIFFQCMAHVEAFIDFSEDENIEENTMDVVKNKLNNLKNVIQVCL